LNTALRQSLSALEAELAPMTHNPAIIARVRQFAAEIGKKTSQRQAVLNLQGVLMQAPIHHTEALERGYSPDSDPFTVLQGDLISTQSAFLMGQRLSGERRFMVLTPTCDLVPERREFASLLEVKPINAQTAKAAELLSSLTAFRRTDAMYLPPTETNLEQGVLGFALVFDGICSISNSHVQMATRLASSSLVGWRVFCAMRQSVLTRAGDDEIALRKVFENHPRSA
jgi:hypothetical protein